MISQSVPQVLSSLVKIVAVFAAMVYKSGYLTIVVIGMLAVFYFVTKYIGGKSATYFVRQQKSLGEVNGYIEEMINGQKVVKMFCHENPSREEFDELYGHAKSANTFANIFVPVVMNIGNIQYVLMAIIGGALAISEVRGLTLGAIAAFLLLSRSFMIR